MDFFLMSSPTEQGQTGILQLLFPFVAVFFIMWLIVIRPYRKEQRERMQMLQNVKKGDIVVTTGGIIGKVVKVKDDRIEIKVDESTGTKIYFLKSAIISISASKESRDSKESKESKDTENKPESQETSS